MAGQPIQPTIDAYGRYARASNLADHLELLCLLGQGLNRKGLADVISDRAWIAKMEEHFDVPTPAPRGEFEDPSEEEAAATADEPGTVQADRVFDRLEERAELLGEHYPFTIGEELRLRDGVDPRRSPYVALLAITLAHAHKLEVAHAPTQLLEEAVVATLKLRGLEAVDVAAAGRGGGGFEETAKQAAVAVGLRAAPETVITMVNANDEKVDSLAHLPWGDLRPGAWAFLGQATCGESDTWSKKMGEPSDETWRLMLKVGVMPFVFLAVPHHVELHHLAKMVQDKKRLVLDRLRLARYREDVTAEETMIVDAVLEVGAEALA